MTTSQSVERSIHEMCACGHEMQFHGNDNICAGCMNTSQERHPFEPVAPSQSVDEARHIAINRSSDGYTLAETIAAIDALIEAVRREGAS